MDKHQLFQALDDAETLARSTRFLRWLNHPLKYTKGLFISKCSFPIWHSTSEVTASTFFGAPMQIVLPAALDIYLCGAKTHDSEIRLARFFVRTINKGMAVVDVGAHYGYFSMLCACLGARVLSVEAAPGLLPYLRNNLLGYQNTSVQHAALADSNDNLSFYEFDGSYSEYNSFSIAAYRNSNWLKKNPPREIQVRTCTLDRICQDHAIHPDVIKIDVEGAEAMVIQGGQACLTTHSPVVVMEYLAGDDTSAHVLAASKLKEWGYFSYLILPDGDVEYCGDIPLSLRSRMLDSDNIVFLKEGFIQS
jgi:FkbM family methyltransferase